jgi:hypothetical protein
MLKLLDWFLTLAYLLYIYLLLVDHNGMNRKQFAIFFLCLMPIYVAPVFSMHICMGQGHHHGNCDGNMKKGSEKQKDQQSHHPYQVKKANHQHCFELEKAKTPTLQPKGDFSVQQLALIIAVFNLKTDTYQQNLNTAYHPPPNKEPPTQLNCIRPPPFLTS